MNSLNKIRLFCFVGSIAVACLACLVVDLSDKNRKLEGEMARIKSTPMKGTRGNPYTFMEYEKVGRGNNVWHTLYPTNE